MQINITRQDVGRFIGWGSAVLFWIALFAVILGLLNSSDRSGAGMVIVFIQMMAAQYFYLLIIPLMIVAWGMHRESKKQKSFIASLCKWGTIASVVYIAVLVFAIGSM